MVWVALAAGAVNAEPLSPFTDGRFTFGMKACPNVPGESVRRILGIEVGDLLLAESVGVPVGRDRLTIRCVENFAWIQADGPASGSPFERIVNLDAFPGDAAPRALALAGLELLASLNAAVRVRIAGNDPDRSPRSTTVVEASAPVPAPTPPARETQIGVAGIWRWFPTRQGPSAWGGQARVRTMVGRAWQLAADGEVAGARSQVAGLGETGVWLFSGAASLGISGGLGAFRTNLGLGGRLGFARMSGYSADPAIATGKAVWHPWGGPMVTASASGRFGRFALSLGAEAGRSLSEANGLVGGSTAIAVRGSWVAITLGGDVYP